MGARFLKNESGQSLFEVILALAVFVMAIATVAHLFLGAQYSAAYSVEKSQAVFLAKEGIEAVRSMRDADFNNMEAKTNDGIYLVADNWQFKGEPDTTEKFTRTINIIVSPRDLEAWQIESTVTWTSVTGKEAEVSFVEDLTDWRLAGVAEPALPVTEGLVLRLDANAITGLNDNDKVAQWDDLSGGGNHATQTTEARRPVYKTGVVNGLPAVRFTAANTHWMQFPRMDAGAKSIIVVYSANLGAGEYATLVSAKTPADNLYSELFAANAVSGYRDYSARFDYMSGGNSVGLENVVYTSDWQVWSVVYNGGSNTSPDSYVLKLNGLGNVVSSGAFGRLADDESTIGGRAPHQNIAFLTGDIAEILIYNRALTIQEREDVEQYLGEKWLGW